MAKEDVLGMKADILNHGHVRIVDVMGDDDAVVQAARVSYGAGTKTKNEDRGLIRYLMRHWHTTPFEMAEIKLHCKMPIFVARQWIRHRTANVNEMSARYSLLPNEFYVPDVEQIAKQSKSNAQGRDVAFSVEEAERIRADFITHQAESYAIYEAMTVDEVDLARELARGVLPPTIYTEWYWKTDVHNLLHFLRLRADSHAQYEIRVFADAILDMFRLWMPLTHEAFWDYRMEAVTLSAHEYEIIRQLTTGECRVNEDALWNALSARETKEFKAKFFPE